jgi:hypothetical protein
MKQLMAGIFALALVASACGSDGEGTSTDAGSAAGDRPAQNACPSDGCSIEILSTDASGTEIEITWSSNFDPDIAKNHIHHDWDIFTADEVSGDAADRGVEQGTWLPTDAYPGLVTSDVISVTERGGSTSLCVTAADRDHSVIDSSAVDCKDVADLLS